MCCAFWIYLSVHPSVCLSICVPVRPRPLVPSSLHTYVLPYVRPCVNRYIRPCATMRHSVHLSFCLFLRLFDYACPHLQLQELTSVLTSARLHVRPHLRPPAHPPARPPALTSACPSSPPPTRPHLRPHLRLPAHLHLRPSSHPSSPPPTLPARPSSTPPVLTSVLTSAHPSSRPSSPPSFVLGTDATFLFFAAYQTFFCFSGKYIRSVLQHSEKQLLSVNCCEADMQGSICGETRRGQNWISD